MIHNSKMHNHKMLPQWPPLLDDIEGVGELTIYNAAKDNLDIYRGLDCSKPEAIAEYNSNE